VYISAGIRQAYQRQGIGTEFFLRAENWAKENGIVRLELTVECENDVAKTLYEKMGFEIEGIRPKSMKVNGRFVDEYYMGKILK
jgi:RimJ/RimL family protein N-acetyltransferase